MWGEAWSVCRLVGGAGSAIFIVTIHVLGVSAECYIIKSTLRNNRVYCSHYSVAYCHI